MPNDWSNFNLSKESKQALEPADFNKSRILSHLDKIQEQSIAKAKQSGDSSKIKEANRFASALEKEKRFIKYSK